MKRRQLVQIRRVDLVVVSALYVVSLALFAIFVGQRPELDPWNRWLAGAVLALLLLPYLGLSIPEVGAKCRDSLAPSWRLPILVVIFPALHAFYAATAGEIRTSAVLTGLLFVEAAAFLAVRVRHLPPQFSLADLLLIVLLWVPLAGWWLPDLTLPPGVGSLHYYRFVAILVALVVFLCIRGVPDVGYDFRWHARDVLVAAVIALLYLFPFALPIGTRAGLLSYELRLRSLPEVLGIVLVIAFLDALPKELLFRGVLQNLVRSKTGRRWLSVLISAVLYGLAHAAEPTAQATAVDLGPLGIVNLPVAYMLLTALAGLFYGLLYDTTRKITVSAFAHTLVDGVWFFFAIPVSGG